MTARGGWVVDENVLVVANGRADAMSRACRLACAELLLECSEENRLTLDSGRKILEKYASHSDYSGQPGVGDQFFVWVHQNLWRIEQVDVMDHPEREFVSFPDSAELVTFDRDDRIYVATALTRRPVAEIVNAADSDYSIARGALEAVGLNTRELCPSELKSA